MKATYLPKFAEYADKGIAYIPVGTIEWHGGYLPIETDFMIATKICDLVAKDYPGYILPPFYLGGYGSAMLDGVEMRGMDRKLKKKLPGNLYFLKKELLVEVLNALVDNLEKQGFRKIIIITGHGGSNQTAALEEAAKNKKVLFVNPYDSVTVHHADEGEISVLWACHPEEEAKSREFQVMDEDLVEYYGYDPIEKSSIEMGKTHLDTMVEFSKGLAADFITKK